MINYIDLEKCTGCGTCFKSCSLDVFRIDTDQELISPCMGACPAGTDVREYNGLLQQGKIEEALQVLHVNNPFPAITGRICFHPCEKECSRASVDGAVNINAIEQFLGDMDFSELRSPVLHVARVAVIGSGPAGMSAALYLARMGYEVTVYEAQAEPGGMLRYGIPAYRLPNGVVRREVGRLQSLGVKFVCGARIGSSPELSLAGLRKQGFKAFVLAPGASESRKLDIPGANIPGVLWGVEFLRAIREGTPPKIGKNVVVIGGGDVAVDAAISARRLGAEQVAMVALESADELPAFPHNQTDAKKENVVFECGWGPVAIIGKNSVEGLEIRQCISTKDGKGAFNPVFNDSNRKVVSCDTVIFAIGQRSNLDAFKNEVEVSGRNCIVADKLTGATSKPDIFAAGDAATGPSSAIAAIAGGREAAISVDRHLRGAHVHSSRENKRPVTTNLPGRGVLESPRNERVEKQACGFEERLEAFDLHTALAESMRCMTCGAKARIAYNDDCMTCFTCEIRCPSDAINVHPFKEIMPRTLEMHMEEN